jgi:prepilin-type N-terminal cleavage/methylation domain-containing protein
MEVRRTARGFSLIEVLIASAIFLVLALGVLPLFTQAVRGNLSGRSSTEVSNFGKSRMEELLDVPFETLAVPGGQTVGVTDEYLDPATKIWKTGTPAIGALWFRTTRIRQFSLADLLDNGVADTPLLGGAPVEQIHFKEIVIEVHGKTAGLRYGGATLRLRRLRAA